MDLYGKDELAKVAESCSTKFSYVYQIALGHRRPSVKLAQKLVKASDHRLDFVSLLTAELKQPKSSKQSAEA